MAGRGNDVDYRSDEHAAATKIQAHFRGHQVRQQTGKRRSTEMQAHLLGGAEQAWGDDTDAVADFLQSIGMEQYTQTFYDNGYDHMDEVSTLREADFEAMGIQKLGHRRRLAEHAAKLQAPSGASDSAALDAEIEAAIGAHERESAAATTIQAAYRGRLVKKGMGRGADAAAPIERVDPRELDAEIEASIEQHERESAAATTIQSAYRGRLVRKQRGVAGGARGVGDADLDNEIEASIQKHERETAAATTVQSAFRGHQVRKGAAGGSARKAHDGVGDDDLDNLIESAVGEHERESAAATTIQSAYRGHAARKGRAGRKNDAFDSEGQHERESAAATTVQAAYRGHAARKGLGRDDSKRGDANPVDDSDLSDEIEAATAEHEKQNEAATTMQSIFRGRQDRRKVALKKDTTRRKARPSKSEGPVENAMTDDVRNRLKQQCLANLKRSHPDVDVSEDDIVVRFEPQSSSGTGRRISFEVTFREDTRAHIDSVAKKIADQGGFKELRLIEGSKPLVFFDDERPVSYCPRDEDDDSDSEIDEDEKNFIERLQQPLDKDKRALGFAKPFDPTKRKSSVDAISAKVDEVVGSTAVRRKKSSAEKTVTATRPPDAPGLVAAAPAQLRAKPASTMPSGAASAALTAAAAASDQNSIQAKAYAMEALLETMLLREETDRYNQVVAELAEAKSSIDRTVEVARLELQFRLEAFLKEEYQRHVRNAGGPDRWIEQQRNAGSPTSRA
eukprot:m.50796 g.50796  ORF g.50796 m.50796 type:complete len:736 (+) comp9028_c0_seq1:180-2387(+)